MQSCATSGGCKCSYKNCSNTTVKNPQLSFFTFPVKDKERCLTWIINSGNDDLSELSDNRLKSRVICSNHFKDTAFTNSLKNRLLQNHQLAVPLPWNINLNDDSPTTFKLANSDSKVISLTSKSCQDIEKSDETFNEFCEYFRPLPDESFICEQDPHNRSTLISTNSPTPRKKKLIKSLSQTKLLLKKKLNSLNFLNKRKTHIDLPTLISSLKQFVSGELLTFLTMQLRHLKKVKWNIEEKNLALGIYYKSPSVYKFLRERGFKLPSLTQIRIWVNVNNVQPGFGDEVFDKLNKKSMSMSEEEKECVILLDEMSIKQALEYNSKLDVVEGFQDLGPLGREEAIATHAMVFMIRGLKNAWKCPVSFVLSHNSIKHASLAILLDLCVSRLRDAGFYPKAIVSDLGSSNAAATKLLGVSSLTPYIMHGNDKIYCIFDFPHLIKCVRNNLLKYDFYVEGKLVSWRDLRMFYDLDKATQTDCRSAPKLSQRHVNPQSFQKMSVKLATQVFSHSVSRGMMTASKLGVLRSPTLENTANFFGRLNDLFDCMNSKNLNDSNPFKKPLSISNKKALKCLEDAVPYIESWSIQGKSKPPCFEGLLQTIRGVIGLFNDMPKNSFVLTNRLNQDPLENLFGVIRQRGGFNSNPTAKEFRRNLQHVMSIRLLDPPESANCEPDFDSTLQISAADNEKGDILMPASNIPDHLMSYNFADYESSVNNQHQTISIISSEIQLAPLEDNVIYYIAGWLAKKCIEKYSCGDCSLALIKDPDTHLTNKEQLIILKSFTCHNGDIAKLNKPSEELHNVTKQQSWHFMKSIKSNIHLRNLRLHIEKSMELDTQENCPLWWNSPCKEHRLYMMKVLIKCKLHNSMKWKSNDIRDKSLFNLSKPSEKRFQDKNKLNSKLKKVKHI